MQQAIEDVVFSGGVVPKWIWGNDKDAKYVLRQSFEISSITAARLRASCDNCGTVYLNGKRVASSSAWQEPMDADVTAAIVEGTNVLEAEVENLGGVAAFVLKLAVNHAAAAPGKASGWASAHRVLFRNFKHRSKERRTHSEG